MMNTQLEFVFPSIVKKHKNYYETNSRWNSSTKKWECIYCFKEVMRKYIATSHDLHSRSNF